MMRHFNHFNRLSYDDQSNWLLLITLMTLVIKVFLDHVLWLHLHLTVDEKDHVNDAKAALKETYAPIYTTCNVVSVAAFAKIVFNIYKIHRQEIRDRDPNIPVVPYYVQMATRGGGSAVLLALAVKIIHSELNPQKQQEEQKDELPHLIPRQLFVVGLIVAAIFYFDKINKNPEKAPLWLASTARYLGFVKPAPTAVEPFHVLHPHIVGGVNNPNNNLLGANNPNGIPRKRRRPNDGDGFQ